MGDQLFWVGLKRTIWALHRWLYIHVYPIWGRIGYRHQLSWADTFELLAVESFFGAIPGLAPEITISCVFTGLIVIPFSFVHSTVWSKARCNSLVSWPFCMILDYVESSTYLYMGRHEFISLNIVINYMTRDLGLRLAVQHNLDVG